MQQGFVIGTAGHIDHGKTRLVRALTGVDLDTLPEEKARGITIALGFTHLRRPGAAPISFVDVPGHERLVRTMIAGASGLDAVLLCISAVEGAMPQTREHLAILQLLGVPSGLVVLTMADLVEPDLLELAVLDAEEAVAGTFLQGAPILPVGLPPEGPPRGLEALLRALDELRPRPRPGQGALRLPIDRAFVRRGFGTVVTGTLASGRLRDGQEVELAPEGTRLRVRGLQIHGQAVAEAEAGHRVAVNLAGVEREDIARGQVLTRPGQVPPARILDLIVRHLPDAPEIEDGATVRVLTGTAEVLAVLSVLDGPALRPGGEHAVQLRTEAPLICLPGDRLILRRESPLCTLGGGELLDPWAPRARRRQAAAHAEDLRRLRAGDRAVLLLRAGLEGIDRPRAALHDLLEHEGGVWLGDRLYARARVEELALALEARLADGHRLRPLSPGTPRAELRRDDLARLGERAFDDLVERSLAQGRIAASGPHLRLPGFRIQPDAAQQALLEAMLARARAAGLEGEALSTLVGGPGDLLAGDALALLVAEGRLVRVADRLVDADAVRELLARVERHLRAEGRLSPTSFKDLTGLSRRTAIPLLEWLDAQGITRRSGDERLPGPKLRA